MLVWKVEHECRQEDDDQSVASIQVLVSVLAQLVGLVPLFMWGMHALLGTMVLHCSPKSKSGNHVEPGCAQNIHASATL